MILRTNIKQTFQSMAARLLIWIMALVMASCGFFALRTEDTLLARVYGSRLYLEDIRGIVPPGASSADSAALISRYLDRWINQQVLLYHAMQHLPAEALDFEQQVRDYHNALIVHSFESVMVKEEMDTVVTPNQIVSYFEANEKNFTLKDHIVHATYIKLPLETPDVNQARSLYRRTDDESLRQLEEYCLQHAATYFIGRDTWMLFNDILRDMPLQTGNPANYLRNNRYAEITDDYYRYFLYIHDHRLMGDIPPMEFEQDNIRVLILNQRKKQFIQQKRLELYNQALNANRIEKYI